MTSHHDVAVRLRRLANIARRALETGKMFSIWSADPETLEEAADLLESQAKALSEWKQAASAEAGLRREFYDRALAAEARLAEFKIEATKVIDELVADLSGEIEGRYAGIKHYPSEARRYARDIAPVVAARAFTNAAKEKT